MFIELEFYEFFINIIGFVIKIIDLSYYKLYLHNI